MQRHWLLVLSNLLLLSGSVTAEQFYVVPSSSTSCPMEPCYTLTEVVLKPSQYFASNTVVTFLPGHHRTNITRDLSVLIKDVKNISMIGHDHTNIHCTRPLGFAFTNVTTLNIAKLNFAFCGAHIFSEFTFTKESRITLYFLRTINVTISEVDISNSKGVGLVGINMLGFSNISQSVFNGNRPNCLLFFVDIPSTSQAIPHTYFNIEDSHVIFGTSSPVRYSDLHAAGLDIMLTQITYNVHVCLNSIEIYSNLDDSSWNGNLQLIIKNWECHYSVIQAKQITSTNIVQMQDIAHVRLQSKSSSDTLHTCNCSKPVEEEYTVHISDSYFVGVSIYVDTYSLHIDCNTRIKLQNITVQNSTMPALQISEMKSIEMQDMNFSYNHHYALLLYHSNIKASGRCYFINNTKHTGTVYLKYKSTLSFDRESDVKFIGNKVEWANVILASESTMTFQQTAELVENEGKVGGTIALFDGSQLLFGAKSNVTFLRNYAQQHGGGVLVDHSIVVVEQEARIQFTENKAYSGGALTLQNRARIMLKPHSQITFIGNHAQQYGGALYIEEPAESYILNLRGYRIICFFDVPKQYSSHAIPNLIFSNNTAGSAGSSLYGGWVNFCTTSRSVPGVHYFEAMFHFQEGPWELSTVSSNPTRVCICINDYPDCNITQYNVTAYPGETFQVPAVAVGQRFGTVPFTVHTRFTSVTSSSPPQMKQLQRTQHVGRNCTNLSYTIASSQRIEDIVLTVEKLDKQIIRYIFLYPDKNQLPLVLKDLHLHIRLSTCPLGFVLNKSSCICHPQLQKHRINCSIDSQKVNRRSSVWINVTFTNGSQDGILVHKHCPFDYCKPDSFNLKLQDPDEQCAFHRSGILCGACQRNLSHVFGTSTCRECSSLWALLWVPVIALAGIALVVLLIVLNLTVSVGTINGLIFYANIVRANHATFFPPNTTNSFLSWFIAWINLDLGIETCFYNGLDAYVKTWLQFVFPLYIWFLVITIIVLSHYFKIAARLSGRNAVPVLATLFLLSYAKLLRIIITVFQSTGLNYPDNSVRKVWFYDGNVNYFKGKHIPLFIAALFLLFISLPYTAIIIFIQYLQQRSSYRSRVLFWVQKLKPLFDAYTGPYKDRHRYWTGLLLLVRTVLFVIFSMNIYGSSEINLLAIVVIVLLLFMHLALAGGVYKSWYLNVIEYSFFLNVGILASATPVAEWGQIAVVYTSVSIAFALFIVIVAFHTLTTLKSLQLCNWISINNLKVKVPELRSALRKLCCKWRSAHHSTQPSTQPGVSHFSIELRESLLEYCSERAF